MIPSFATCLRASVLRFFERHAGHSPSIVMRHIVSSMYWPISLEDWLCLSWKSTFNFMDPSVSKLNFGRLLHWAMLLGRPDNASYALRRSKGDKVARRITHESLGWSKNCFGVGKIIKWSRSRAPYHIILQNQKLSSKSVIITKSHHSSTTFTMSTMISSISENRVSARGRNQNVEEDRRWYRPSFDRGRDS